jgi:hypothetical protein
MRVSDPLAILERTFFRFFFRGTVRGQVAEFTTELSRLEGRLPSTRPTRHGNSVAPSIGVVDACLYRAFSIGTPGDDSMRGARGPLVCAKYLLTNR